MILVTGGTGLVGAHLLYRLVSNGNTVRATYRSEHKFKNVKHVFATYTTSYEALFDKIEWVKADILDIPELTEAFTNIDYVYHCAAFVSFEPDKYKQLRRTNIEGTANIVNLCLASKSFKKLCYVSSIATIGASLRASIVNENTTWNPEDEHNVYAITKYGAELEVWRGVQEGLSAVIVNPGVILGAGIWHYGSGSLFKKTHKGMKHYTSGATGFVDVSDVISIMILLLESAIANERFIVVAKNWTYKAFLQHTANSLGVTPPKKLAKPWLLGVGWRLDWFVHTLTGKRRSLTKNLAKTLSTTSAYDNSKLLNAIDYEFKPVEQTIKEVAKAFLEAETS